MLLYLLTMAQQDMHNLERWPNYPVNNQRHFWDNDTVHQYHQAAKKQMYEILQHLLQEQTNDQQN